MRKFFAALLGFVRGTALAVGLAVMLAAVLGLGTAALAADGNPFLLGRQNVSQAVSTLVKRGVGPALSLKVGAGQPPLAVNSPGKVANLNADSLDGKDASEFAPGKAEAWRVVDEDYGGSGFYVASTGQCAGVGRPNWMDQARFGNDWARTAYFKDQAGVVHLKGQVRDNSSCWAEYDQLGEHAIVFVLPAGYRPPERQAFATTSNHAFGEVLIRPDGAVVALRGSFGDFSLNGLSFRAAN